jgi:hypothetical protein
MELGTGLLRDGLMLIKCISPAGWEQQLRPANRKD